MIKKMILTGMLVFVAAFAFGEYYQYTDDSGNQRFTDDLTQVPDSQRQTMKTVESIKNAPDETKPNEFSGDQEIEDSAPSDNEKTGEAVETNPTETIEGEAAGSADEGKKTLRTKAEELDKMQADLNKTKKELEDERAALDASTPKRGASSQQTIEYSAKVDNLNAKIEKYKEKVNSFNEKVNEFNNPAPKKEE